MTDTEAKRYRLYIEQIEALERDREQVLKEAQDDGFTPEALIHLVAHRKLEGYALEEIREYFTPEPDKQELLDL